MKRFITILLSFLFISFQSVKAEVGFGISGAYHMLEADGHEITRNSGQRNAGNHSDDILVPEAFLEIINGDLAMGLSYIPTRDMGGKSRSDTNGEGDTGTYTAAAEFDNVIQFYFDYSFAEALGASIYSKIGVQHATLVTVESLNSGSTYPNEDLYGLTLGLGAKGDLAGNVYYKTEVAYTNFEDYDKQDTAGTGNKVEADLEDIAVRLSLGYKF